jgi:autotransporter-associated beta strand protein
MLLSAALLAAVPTSRASDFTWGNSGTDWGTPANWVPPGPPGANDTPIFNTFSTGGVLINPDLAAAFAVQAITIGSGPNLGNYTFTGAGSLALSTTSTGGTFTMRGNQTATFDGPSISGFSGTNTALFSIGFGSNLVLTGNSVANTNIGAVTLRGGSITADNSLVNPGTQRLATGSSVNLTGGGGGLVFKGNSAGSTFNGLTGALNVNAGDTFVRVEQPVGAGAPTLVNFGSLSRANTNTTINFNNGGDGVLGGGFSNPAVTFTTAPTVRQGVISTSATTTLPYAFVSQTVAGVVQADWANYNVSTGVSAAVTTSFTGDFNGATAGTNVRFEPNAAGTVNLGVVSNQLATVNLAPTVAGVTLDATGTRMNTFGVMLSGGNDITVSGGEMFTTSNGTRTLIVANPTTALSTDSLLATTNNPVNKSGDGFLILTGSSNQIAYPAGGNAFNLNGGTLRVTPQNFDLVAATAPTLRIRGGTLEYDVTTGSHTFDRSLGQGAGNFNWANAGATTQIGSGGFSAFTNTPGNTLTVNIGGASQPLTWNGSVGADANFVQSGYALQFGSRKSNATVVWQNPINLDSAAGTYALRTIEVTRGVGNAADRTRMTGVIAGSATTDLMKTGDGTLEFTAPNTYGGRTIVQNGTLVVNNSSGSGTGTGTLTVKNAGRLSGAGAIVPAAGNSVEIEGTVAPGNSAGRLTLGSVTDPTAVSITGRYQWELESAGNPSPLNSGGSSASAAQDFLDVFGSLAADVTVDLAALGNTGFNPAAEYSWTIASATTGVTGTANVGAVEGTDFQFLPGFFFLTVSGPNLFLNYNPVPEPATVLSLCAAGLAVGGWIRRRRQATRQQAS